MLNAPRWTIVEIVLEARREYSDPLHEVDIEAHFTGPDGSEHVVDAFWDGDVTWRIRFSPDQTGQWFWRTQANVSDPGLSRQSGQFNCVAYQGDNPLYLHGPLRVAESATHLEHADGTPFFYLADTAWNGVLKAHAGDWQEYLDERREQNFTVIQFVTTQWRAFDDRRAFSMGERLSIEPTFFQRLDAKMGAINQTHLVAAPVLLWSYGPNDPGQALPEGAALMLARYIVARWGAGNVIWLFGGDGDYRADKSQRWQRLGRELFSRRHDRLVTMHPMGHHWVEEEFRDEPWYDFIGYQSGHNQKPQTLNWLIGGPPALQWDVQPRRPLINLEPCYEFLKPGGSPPNTAYDIRRAIYRSLLVHPTAGVTYGSDPIWVWNEQPAAALGHEELGTVEPWRTGLNAPGVEQMALMAQIFDDLPWTQLRPAQDLMPDQPQPIDPSHHVVAARTVDGKLAVAYLPTSAPVTVNLATMAGPIAEALWFDPESGAMQTAEAELSAERVEFVPPAPEVNTDADGGSSPSDWLLILRC